MYTLDGESVHHRGFHFYTSHSHRSVAAFNSARVVQCCSSVALGKLHSSGELGSGVVNDDSIDGEVSKMTCTDRSM